MAASNPCPCGYLGDRDVACRCSDAAVERYQAKLGGPLADRIDIVLHIARPDPSLIIEGAEGLSTKELADMVRRGRAFRASRERARGGPAQGSLSLESSLAPALIDSEAREVMLEIAKRTNLTGRGIARLARIARAIADLEEADRVDVAHVLEASQLQGRRDVGGGYGQV